MASRLHRGATRTQHEHPPLPILAVDSSGTVTRANGPARKVLSPLSTEDGLEGHNIGFILGKILASEEGPDRNLLLSLSDVMGEHRDLLLALSPGKPVIASDTAAVLVAEAPPRRDREPGRITDFIAHELKNPIGTILGLTQTLTNRGGNLSSENKQTAVTTIHEEAGRALLILQGLLRLAEAKTKDRVETGRVPLHAVLRRVVENHRQVNPHRQLRIMGQSPLFARANSLWVELAVANLLNNAEKHTPKDREIEVTFHENGNRATVVVQDDGVGLREELYASLWDIYYTGPDRDVVVSGSGIGLALCKELVETMGGQVWAGPSKKRGSVFAISLPALWDSEFLPPASAAPTSALDAAFPPVPVGMDRRGNENAREATGGPYYRQ
ncbi:MAG: hypothetical protein GEU75_01280 [Dehalococcoidia bacterium]|nr:hypothetical protein [Dehalococcoidia bacterium]